MEARVRRRYLAAGCFTLAGLAFLFLLLPGAVMVVASVTIPAITRVQVLPTPPPTATERLNEARNATEMASLRSSGFLWIGLGLGALIVLLYARRGLLGSARANGQDDDHPGVSQPSTIA